MLGALRHTNTADHEQIDYSMENSTPILNWTKIRGALVDRTFIGLLRSACEAVQWIEQEGLLDKMPKTERFRIIIAEHDEPDDLCVNRYPVFLNSGLVLY